MLGSEAVTIMKRRLRRSTGTDASFDTWVLDEMKAAQTRLEISDMLPWFLITERSSKDIVDGEERVLVPADFIRETEEELMQIEDTATGNFTELDKDDYEGLKVRFADEEAGLPARYALVGDYFRLRPIPNLTTLKLWMVYYGNDAVIVLGQENDWLKYAPDLLIAEAGLIIAMAQGNQQAITLFTGMHQIELTRIHRQNVARAEANKPANPED